MMAEVISEQEDNMCKIRAADGLELDLSLINGENIESKYIQIKGKYENNIMNALRIQSAGEKFDLNNFNKLVEFSRGKFNTLYQ